MRKMTGILLCTALLCTGCSSSSSSKQNSAKLTAYAGYYKAIEENTKWAVSSNYYTLSAEMSTLPDGTYRYYIVADEAQIAMYDIVMMAVQDHIEYEQSTVMMPTIGIFDTTDYSMIPYQVDKENGFVEGMVISGECSQPDVILNILVEWHDSTNENTYREFFAVELTPEGFTAAAEAQTEAAE